MMKFDYRVDKIAKDHYDSLDEWKNKTNYGYLVQIVTHALECELATVEHLSMLKTSSKSSIARHCSIAQTILAEEIRDMAAMAIESEDFDFRRYYA